MRFDLSDEDRARLEPLLPKSRKSARVDDRKITTAYNRFNRWSRRGVWKRVFDQLASKSRDSLYLIDSTIVKAHRVVSGAKGGAKSSDRHRPGRPNHENPRHCRQQGPAAELHGDGRTGP